MAKQRLLIIRALWSRFLPSLADGGMRKALDTDLLEYERRVARILKGLTLSMGCLLTFPVQ